MSIHDYRPTLAAWFRRLAERKQEAIALVGVRHYNRYLMFFAGSWRLFDDSNLFLVRFVLEPTTTVAGEIGQSMIAKNRAGAPSVPAIL